MNAIQKRSACAYDPVLVLVIATLVIAPANAAQIDIPGPLGSLNFGGIVTLLPNGNFVVADYKWNSYKGAVYLYTRDGTLISTLTGSNAFDQVGESITVLKNGNFVVGSPSWNNNTGAATFVNGATGLSAPVSSANSLVGNTPGDYTGSITALSNGNYVVTSPQWHNLSNASVGAVTWADGNTGISGSVSAGNSLTGSTAGDVVGVGLALPSGNFVVICPFWHNGGAAVGAVTWVNGSGPVTDVISTGNSLYGTTDGDRVGLEGITALTNGNYVVNSATWHNGSTANAGAVTWGSGTAPLVGPVSASNSLVGSSSGDSVGMQSVIPLSNGNYVVPIRTWDNGSMTDAGAATWADGTQGITGPVSESNSLVGTPATGGGVGTQVTALTNGNYVVSSPGWNNGTASVGAATWVNGATGATGVVTTAHSIVGSTGGDQVGYYGAIALSNGNYVVLSPNWHNGSISNAGAATWGNGGTGTQGIVSTANSLVRAVTDNSLDMRFAALINGNYVIASSNWSNGSATNIGAVTWCDGNGPTSATVSAANSLVGSVTNDFVGRGGVTALANGNYVVASYLWNNGGATQAGAVTWGDGRHVTADQVSPLNSLVGSVTGDQVGGGGASASIVALSDGSYAVRSDVWNNGGATQAEAITLGRGWGGIVGPISNTNSVRGTIANGGQTNTIAYDAKRGVLIVGQPKANIVSLFTGDQIFRDGIE